ncbi:hypothetical protein L596_004497 [Steinernema carpocapsae]|uniref:Uncharacterized protein n=1 Tax=Steinernema carpocapsae TaxID=34508 RepID=A0A4U8V045_STECR|nr:hypothetical protein L596_004497 [Steinernema carpocapsae]
MCDVYDRVLFPGWMFCLAAFAFGAARTTHAKTDQSKGFTFDKNSSYKARRKDSHNYLTRTAETKGLTI